MTEVMMVTRMETESEAQSARVLKAPLLVTWMLVMLLAHLLVQPWVVQMVQWWVIHWEPR